VFSVKYVKILIYGDIILYGNSHNYVTRTVSSDGRQGSARRHSSFVVTCDRQVSVQGTAIFTEGAGVFFVG
jgi:hypothetical protein